MKDLADVEYARLHLRRLVYAYGSQSRAALALAAYYGLTFDTAHGWFAWLRPARNTFKSPGVCLMLEQMPPNVNPFAPRERPVPDWDDHD